MTTNLNDLAKKITLAEGKKEELSIAQVKEVLKLAFEELASMSIFEIADVLKRYKKKE